MRSMVSIRRGKQYTGHNTRRQAKAPPTEQGRERGRGPRTAKPHEGKRRKRRPPARPRAAKTRRPRRGWPKKTAAGHRSRKKKDFSDATRRKRLFFCETNQRPVVWALVSTRRTMLFRPPSGKPTVFFGRRSLPRDDAVSARWLARDDAFSARSVQKRSKNLRKNLRMRKCEMLLIMRMMRMRTVRNIYEQGGRVGHKENTLPRCCDDAGTVSRLPEAVWPVTMSHLVDVISCFGPLFCFFRAYNRRCQPVFFAKNRVTAYQPGCQLSEAWPGVL